VTASQRIQPAALLQLAGAVVALGGSWPVTRHALLLSAAWLDEAMAPDLLPGAGLVLGGAVVAALPGRRMGHA